MSGITFVTQGQLAIATLDRPAALNAQNLEMVTAFARQLQIWEDNPAITRLLIRGAGDKAFCAGGDVKGLWSQSPEARLAFFKHEYALCAALKNTRLHTIAYMDGITMGGGVGLSIYADHRIATGRTRWAMPEVRIGFFLDIAASHFLNHVTQPALGRYLAMTGANLTGADCLASGIATHYCRAGQDDALIEQLAISDDIDSVWHELADLPFAAAVPLFETGDADLPLPEFMKQLAARGLLSKTQRGELCSLSLLVMDKALRRGRTQTYEATLAMDDILVRHFLDGTTFREGVRARLIDRGSQPDWAGIGPDEINPVTVQRYFEPIY